LIVKYPNQKNAGNRCDNLTSVIDITATILDIANCIGLKELWGQFEPLGDCDRKLVFAETMNHQFMVRTQTSKLLYYPPGKSQFFRLDQDPLELTDLYEDPESQPEISSLKEKLLNWFAMDAAVIPNTNTNGTVISGENVIGPHDENHKKVEEWLREQMKEYLIK
jgi:arylsulfatase A-like enzyme